MKRTLRFAVFLSLGLMFLPSTGYATSFSNINTYNEEIVFGGEGFSSVFAQSLTFSPAVGAFTLAMINIAYADISAESEVWVGFASNTPGTPGPTWTNLGQLAPAGSVGLFTADLIAKGLTPTIPLGGLTSWTLYVSFRESTPGADAMMLKTIEIEGEYTPQAVPEPGTALLLGIGLLGLAGRRLRRTK